MLTELARHANVLRVPLLLNAPAASDRGEQFLWDLLISTADLMRVTGDKLLMQAGPLQPRVLMPQDFVAQLLDWRNSLIGKPFFRSFWPVAQ